MISLRSIVYPERWTPIPACQLLASSFNCEKLSHHLRTLGNQEQLAGPVSAVAEVAEPCYFLLLLASPSRQGNFSLGIPEPIWLAEGTLAHLRPQKALIPAAVGARTIGMLGIENMIEDIDIAADREARM